MFLRPLSSDVEIDAAIPTVRNLVYAKASHSGTLHAGHRAWEMLACLSQSRPQRPLACRPQSLGCYRHADSIFLPRCAPRVPKGGWSEFCKKKRRLYIITCVLGWPVLDSRSFLEIQPREVKIVYYSHLHAYSIFLPWFAPRV